MSTLADLLNCPNSVTYGGKEYPLRDLTFEERAMVCRRLERRAEEALGRAFGRMPREAWDAWSGNVASDIAAGKYEYGGLAYLKALTTVDGWAYVLHLALKADHPEAADLEWCTRMVAELTGEKLMADVEKIQRAADPGN